MGNKRKRAAKEPTTNGDNQPLQKRSKSTAAEQTNGSAKTKSSKAPLDKSPFAEILTNQERARELEVYNLLGSLETADRLAAADAIISGLLGGDGVPEPVMIRHLDSRLFRGLASGRNASRLGFSLVLTEILGQLFGEKDLASEKYPGLTFEKILAILVERTQAGSGASGQEEKDCLFGRLFGLESFVRSGILFSDKRRWMAVLDMVLELASKKSWVKSQCGFVIVQAISEMKKKHVEKTLAKLAEQGFAKTPEGVGIWITALDRFPDLQVPAQPWRNPLAPASLQALPAVLKDSGREQSNEQGNKLKQGAWTAQLHFVWDIILAHFVKLIKEQPEAADEFKVFWKRIVDEGFFSRTSSETQKFSGFMMFQKMIEGAVETPQMISALFSQNFLSCLMNQAAKEDRYLHRAAIKALKALEAAVEQHPDLLPVVLRQLLGENGAYNFDQRSSTKTVDKLLQHTNPTTLKAVIKVLKPKDPSKTGLDEQKFYMALGNYLSRLASAAASESVATGSTQSVSRTAMQLLTELAYSDQSVPEKMREGFRTKCTSSFARLARRPEDFADLCNAILSIETEKGEDDDETAWSAMLQAYERLKELLDPKNETDATRAQRQALSLLHAVGILQFHNRDPDAIELLDELEECYNKLSGEEGLSEFLVEILLALVSRPSSLMRKVSQQVFEAFTPMISATALELLTDPLATDENEKGQQALFSTEDEDMADADAGDDEEDNEEELDSDVDIADLEDAGSEAPEDSDAESDDDEEDSKEQDKEQEELDALDNALAQVLNSHRLDKDAEAESSDDHGSDMSDSEMMEVDAKLAEIFKQRAKTTNKKKQQKEAKETVVMFKHRILDLLAIYVKKEAAVLNPLAFRTLVPLLELIRFTTDKPLSNKASEIIREFQKSLKKARSNRVENKDIHAEELKELLKEIHEEVSKYPSHAFARAVSTASICVASVLCADKENRKDVLQQYANTQMKVLEGVRIQDSFFIDWTQWCGTHASPGNANAKKEKA